MQTAQRLLQTILSPSPQQNCLCIRNPFSSLEGGELTSVENNLITYTLRVLRHSSRSLTRLFQDYGLTSF